MDVICPRCAGLDVHKQTVVACVRIAGDGAPLQEVRSFDTTTSGLLALADWLESFGVEHVAMEATGVYWKPVWHVLEGHFELVLANAAHVKNVPGRKTDVNDAMWLADLLAHGLIRASFVPPVAVQELRTLTRTRKQFVRERAAHVQRIEKVLEDANLKLSVVLSDILGKAGRAVLQALVDGHSDPEYLASRITTRVKASRTELLEALRGRVSAHHRFMLKVHLSHIDALDKAVASIETEVGCRPEALSAGRQTAEHHARLERGQCQRGGRRDRHRHVALRYPRAPAVLGLHVPAQRRERRQAPQHPLAPRRQVAQDHRWCKRPGRPSRSKAATCRRSSTACVRAAAPRRPSSAWPLPCSLPPGTCCATAPNGTNSAPRTSTAPMQPRPPTG